jgi:ATP-binding cassette subfamily F protein uup
MSEQLFIMEGDGIVNVYNGNYSEYRTSLETEKNKEIKTPKTAEVSKSAPATSKKLTYKEQKELEDAEASIAELENKIADLTASLLKIDSAEYLKMQEVNQIIETHQKQLDAVTERWLELSEKTN